jgi:hypothetical protein
MCLNYISLLEEMDCSARQIGERFSEAGKEAGFDQDSFRNLVAQLQF